MPLKGEKSTDPDFLVAQYESFLDELLSLTLRPSSLQLARTVKKAHDCISRDDAREWAKKMCFLITYIRTKKDKITSGTKTAPAVTRLAKLFDVDRAMLPVAKPVLWKGASKVSPQKRKVKSSPQKEKKVEGAQKRKATSESAAASKRQSILAAWGAEAVESSEDCEFLEVDSSPETMEASQTEDIASCFFDQHQLHGGGGYQRISPCMHYFSWRKWFFGIRTPRHSTQH